MVSIISDPSDIVNLTRALVNIPSYVQMYDNAGSLLSKAKRVNEIRIADYIVAFLTQHTNLTIRKQKVSQGRYNIIAANSQNPRIVLLGHMDTVRPSYGGKCNPLMGTISNGNLYGLGASDMKSGVACFLSALALCKDIRDVMLILYVDEEYDFLGMQAILKDLPGISPKLLLSADGSDMSMGNGCRGLMEIHGNIFGVSAHAGRPHQGVNAIYGTVDAMRFLTKHLNQYSHPILGASSLNLARVNAGKIDINSKTSEISVVEQINSVPDVSQFKVDIRPSSPDIKAAQLVNKLHDYCNMYKLKLDNVTIQHNYGAWYTEPEELYELERIISSMTGNVVEYANPSLRGYIDLQMLWDALGRPPAVTFGPGPSSVCHQIDEYCEVYKLIMTRDIFVEVLKNFGV